MTRSRFAEKKKKNQNGGRNVSTTRNITLGGEEKEKREEKKVEKMEKQVNPVRRKKGLLSK